MAESLPQSVRYVKNGASGRWWAAAKAHAQLHCGWWFLPRDLLQRLDLQGIEAAIRDHYKKPAAGTTDVNAIKSLIESPSQHLWVTFEDGYLWWCTVNDEITVNIDKHNENTEGSFWLTCKRPWSNRSIGGRLLARSDLPGPVTAVAGFRAMICEPSASTEILRIIQDKEDPDCIAAALARDSYTGAVAKLVKRLHERDFELLIDLILTRTGWMRLAEAGGTTEGVDIEVQNATADEIAFVQVKSRAAQAVLDDYVERFRARRDRYDRMIFAVHSAVATLDPPTGEPIQVWNDDRIAQLSVQLGLGEWIAKRL